MRSIRPPQIDRVTRVRKTVLIAVLVSAAAHVLFYLLIGRSWFGTSAVAGHSGIVSIAFVEAVNHQAPASPVPSVGPAKRPLPRGPRVSADRLSTPRATQPTTAAAGDQAGPAADEVGRFVAEVGRLIDQRKEYPRPALNRELEGRVVVALTIESDGRLSRSEVEEPTPYALLNEAALGAVRAVERYPPLPAHAGASLHLHVPIVFKIKH